MYDKAKYIVIGLISVLVITVYLCFSKTSPFHFTDEEKEIANQMTEVLLESEKNANRSVKEIFEDGIDEND